MSDLSSLIARVEAETGPDRELDEAVALTLNIYVRERRGKDRQYWFYKVGGNDYERRSTHRYAGSDGLPFYTSSIDAALTLLPEGAGYSLQGADDTYYAVVAGHYSKCPTPALALLSAILKAWEPSHEA